nr:hypothetical protein [bacterium]
MERILCALLIALLLCLSFACQSDDDDDDAPADDDDDDDDDNDDDNDDDDDDDMDDDSDDDTDDLDGAHPIVATSFGNFLVFFDLFDATAALPKLSAETEFGFVEQLIGGMSGNRFVGLAMAPAESIGQLTAQSLFNVYEAALAADANGVLHLATITRNPNRLHYYTLQDGMPSEEQTWDYSSLIGFNSLSLIFDADDQAHLFFITGLPPDYTLQHIYRDNDGWQSENAFAGYVIRYQAVGDAQNTLHVALGTEQAILYGTNGSGAWQFQTVLDDYITPGIPTDLSHPQIALNGDGRPMIAALYYGHTQGYLPKVITHVWFAEQFDAGTPLAKVWENNQYDYRQLTMGTDAAGAPHLVLTGEFDRHLWFADGVWNDKYLSFPSDNHLLLVGDERDRLHLLGYGPLEYSDEKSVLYKRYREGEWNDTSRVGPDGLEMRSLLVATATDGRRNIFARGHDPYFVSGEPGDWAVEPLALLIPYGLYHNLLLDSAD